MLGKLRLEPERDIDFGREGLESWLGATSQLQAVVDDVSSSRHRPALNTFSWFFERSKAIRFPEKTMLGRFRFRSFAATLSGLRKYIADDDDPGLQQPWAEICERLQRLQTPSNRALPAGSA
jgi:hypothetical protein